MRRDRPLFLEERVGIARKMINEDTLCVFGRLTERQSAFVWRLIGVLDGDRQAVPRKHRSLVRRPR